MGMKGDSEAADEESPGAHARHVKPAEQPHSFDLGAPVSASEAMGHMASPFVDDASRLQESLERRMADRQLLKVLSSENFTGPRYVRFTEELARYGISVLRGMMHSGYVFKLVALRGYALNPTESELEELVRNSDVRDELATMTVARALPRFRKHALVDGGWRFEGVPASRRTS